MHGWVMRHVEHVNPGDDSVFRALVDELGAASTTPGELERRLQATYPDALVRPRGLSGENVDVWYVYRDGFWTRAVG
jgi:hypothetical protein